jgi:hypothetical protein
LRIGKALSKLCAEGAADGTRCPGDEDASRVRLLGIVCAIQYRAGHIGHLGSVII